MQRSTACPPDSVLLVRLLLGPGMCSGMPACTAKAAPPPLCIGCGSSCPSGPVTAQSWSALMRLLVFLLMRLLLLPLMLFEVALRSSAPSAPPALLLKVLPLLLPGIGAMPYA